MKLLIAFFAIALAGCVSLQEAREKAPLKSSYALCSNLATAALASNELREIWAMELQRRGENCAQFSGTIAAQQNANAQLMQLTNQISQPRHVSQPVTRTQSFLKRSFVSGVNRICVYDDLGSERFLTISSVAICPLSN